MVIKQIYLETAACLKKNPNITDSSFEARQLCSHVFGMLPLEIVIAENECTSQQYELLQKLIKKRIGGYPLQYLLQRWEFYGIELEVGPGVLIPRADSELLAEQAIKIIDKKDNPRVLDLCSGSGCVAIAIKHNCNFVSVYALEISDRAIQYLRRNISRTGVHIEVIEDDLRHMELTENIEPFDLITANPPYLSSLDMQNLQTEVGYEPKIALYGGEDGLDFYKFIACEYKKRLKSGGKLLFEAGFGQSDSIKRILEQNAYTGITCHRDLSGILRVIEATKS